MSKKVNGKINELIAMGCLQPDDPKFDFFKKQVVPAVVNEWITPEGQKSHSYKCPFAGCGVIVSRGRVLERHLREKHYDQIPIGVFGKLNIYECRPCEQSFKRKEHLNRHLEGRSHLKCLIKQGIATEFEKQKWTAICAAKRQKSGNTSTSSVIRPKSEPTKTRNDTIVLDSNNNEDWLSGLDEASLVQSLDTSQLLYFSLSDDWTTLSSCSLSICQNASHLTSSSSSSESTNHSQPLVKKPLTSTPVGNQTNQQFILDESLLNLLNASSSISITNTQANPSSELSFQKTEVQSSPILTRKILVEQTDFKTNANNNYPQQLPSQKGRQSVDSHINEQPQNIIEDDLLNIEALEWLSDIEDQLLFQKESFINLLNTVETRALTKESASKKIVESSKQTKETFSKQQAIESTPSGAKVSSKSPPSTKETEIVQAKIPESSPLSVSVEKRKLKESEDEDLSSQENRQSFKNLLKSWEAKSTIHNQRQNLPGHQSMGKRQVFREKSTNALVQPKRKLEQVYSSPEEKSDQENQPITSNETLEKMLKIKRQPALYSEDENGNVYQNL